MHLPWRRISARRRRTLPKCSRHYSTKGRIRRRQLRTRRRRRRRRRRLRRRRRRRRRRPRRRRRLRRRLRPRRISNDLNCVARECVFVSLLWSMHCMASKRQKPPAKAKKPAGTLASRQTARHIRPQSRATKLKLLLPCGSSCTAGAGPRTHQTRPGAPPRARQKVPSARLSSSSSCSRVDRVASSRHPAWLGQRASH